jgi:hypothetical protein
VRRRFVKTRDEAARDLRDSSPGCAAPRRVTRAVELPAAPRDPSRRITRRAVHRARYAPPVVPSDTLRGPLWTNLSRPVRIAPAQA